MAKLEPSPQQQAVIDFVFAPEHKSDSLVVEASAGSGKTTTILEATYRSGDPTTLLCAFNRRIADELIERLSHRPLPRGRMIKAMTLHGIGLSIVRAHEQVQLDREATDALVHEVCPSLPFKTKRCVVKAVRHLKETCTQWENQIELTDLIGRLALTEDAAQLTDVVLGATEVMNASKAYRPTIDFCDMIWRPWALNLAPRGRYKTVVVDEAQDLSLGQFHLIERQVAPGGRLILVGDLRQEIYEWRGAIGQEIWATMRDKHKATFLPLTWSFRCARKIIEEARQIVPKIEPRPNAPDGIVDVLLLDDALKEVAVGDFFLSRTNAGAVTSAIKGFLRGAQVRVLGGYEELEPILQLLQRFDLSSREKFTEQLVAWKDTELNKPNISDATAERVEDRFELLQQAASLVEPRKLAQVMRSIFKASDVPAAIFSTVHKAKGLEASRVFLLRDTFERHKVSRDGHRKTLAEVDLEEQNIEYVAITRAIDHLTWVATPGSELIIDDSPVSYGSTSVEDTLVPSLNHRIHQALEDHVRQFPGGLDPNDEEGVKAAIDLGIDPFPYGHQEEP